MHAACGSGKRQAQREARAARRRGSARRACRPCSLASVSHRLRPRPRPSSRVLKKGSKMRGSASGAMPRPLSLTVSTPCPPVAADATPRGAARRRGTSSSACSAFISRLCTICSSATGSACTRTGAGAAASNARLRRRAARTRAPAGAARCAPPPAAPPAAASPLASGRSITRRSRPTTSAARRACSTACSIAVRAVASSGRVVVEQAARGLRVGQHRRQRLVEFVRHAGRQLAQRIEPRDLPEPQQFLGAAALDALALQQRAGAGQQHGHRQRPGGHRGPGQLAPADTWRSATTSKAWLSEASALRKSKCQPPLAPARAGLHHELLARRARASRAPGWSSGPSASRATARCRARSMSSA